jgi:uncharacterized protein
VRSPILISVASILLASAVVAVASALHGAVGLGLNLLAVPLLVLIDPALVPGPALVAGLLLAGLMTGREFAAMDRRLGYACLGLVPGGALGILLLTTVSQDGLSVLIGVLILVAVGLSVLRWRPTPTRGSLLGAGTASGLLSTTAAVGGPPMALLYADARPDRLRSTLSGFFVVAAVLSLALLAVVGEFGADEARWSVTLLPAVALGFYASGGLRRFVDRERSRRLVLGLSAAAAVVAILDGLLG